MLVMALALGIVLAGCPAETEPGVTENITWQDTASEPQWFVDPDNAAKEIEKKEQRKFVDGKETSETRWVATGNKRDKVVELELPAWDKDKKDWQNIDSKGHITSANGGATRGYTGTLLRLRAVVPL
jgi:hypothetical protein